MQTCSRISAGILAGLIILFCSPVIFAQSLDMPSMPEITDLDMPEISAPSMDGKFYKPTVPKNYTKKPKNTETAATEPNTTEAVLSDATSTDDLLMTLLTNSNMLTASDISGLYATGSFNTVSSLTGNNSTDSTTALLKEILQRLNELKIEQKTAGAAEQEIYAAKKQDSETFKTRKPSVLRFKINSYSIKDSLTQTFLSDPEPDGSFLLTADRKYFLNNKSCSETFYMLFKAVKSNGNTTTFSVTPSIAQGTENKNSYVYKLCQCKDIIAEKTGNLVVVHYVSEDVTTDLLLDIDK